ncbi:MAG: hypothetical protein U5K75_11295 [Ahrensia sp.]|nr:hypothetical protein [Ahrensia sp.]
MVFRNINIYDPSPTFQQFFLCMTMPEPYSKNGGGKARRRATSSGILFQNIPIAAPQRSG